MCGILGFYNHKGISKKTVEALKIIENRGKDGVGVYTGKFIETCNSVKELKLDNLDGKNIIVHVLHSIISHVKQPLKKDGVLVINCEIYNWKYLANKHNVKVNNDAELILELFDKQGVKKTLKELDGVYAFAYWKGNDVIIGRDILGVKPLWYSLSEGFAFCSESKGLTASGVSDVQELNPRELIIYNSETNKTQRTKRGFFKITPELTSKKQDIDKQLKKLIVNSISKRIPDVKTGVLFSGGIDSTLIAWLLKQKNQDFTCYTAVLDHPDFSKPEDLIYSEKIAEDLGFKLKIVKIKFEDVESYIKRVINLIEDINVVKVGVGVTFLAAAEAAKKDNVKVIFSGLGSEEIFAGYERHGKTENVNKECLSGLLKMYERDTYRDDVIMMSQNLELRVPFLDLDLVNYSLKIPARYKLINERSKAILRDVTKQLGVPIEYAERKKRAAQYGSKFDRAIKKLARNNGFKKKSEYLKQFAKKSNLKLGVLFSGGKDSVYALWTMIQQNYEVSCLITIKSKNPDSYMFHTPNIHIVDLQAEAMNIPLVTGCTEGEKEHELEDLEKTIKQAKEKFKIEGIVTGALFSDYQRRRIEKICDKLNLKIFSPLWHMDQELEMRNLLKAGFKVVLGSISADGLTKDWLLKTLTNKDVDNLVELNNKIGLNIAGEGGEFESLVLDGPLFSKKIIIQESEVIHENKYTARAIIHKANLVNK